MGYADVSDRNTSNTVKPTTKPVTTKRKIRTSSKSGVGSVAAQIAAAQNNVDAINKSIKDVDNKITDLKKVIDDFETNTGLTDVENRKELNKLNQQRANLLNDLNAAIKVRDGFKKIQSEKAQAAYTAQWNAKAEAAGVKLPGANSPDASITGLTAGADLAKVNLSAARELYFKGNEEFIKETLDVQGFGPTRNKSGALTSGGGSFNSPTFASAFADYQVAQNLWKSGKATKGRIQTWMPPSNTLPNFLQTANSAVDLKSKQIDLDRRIFQFHYNPGSINMAYNGVPDIDVTMYTAGIERFNLWNQSKSTIAFELLLNRMPDMKYIDPKAGNYRKSGVNYATDVYDRNPVNDELKEIHEKGTMYDVEFLLRVLLGYRLKSQLRGGKLTSDVGWITPRPVELHLGSSLRYLVNIVDLRLNHVIFNERMVPLFTTVSITGTRIPDFDSTTSASSGGKQ